MILWPTSSISWLTTKYCMYFCVWINFETFFFLAFWPLVLSSLFLPCVFRSVNRTLLWRRLAGYCVLNTSKKDNSKCAGSNFPRRLFSVSLSYVVANALSYGIINWLDIRQHCWSLDRVRYILVCIDDIFSKTDYLSTFFVKTILFFDVLRLFAHETPMQSEKFEKRKGRTHWKKPSSLGNIY